MRKVFAGGIILAFLLLLIATTTRNTHSTSETIRLVWATDDNPARQEQMTLFRKWYQEHYQDSIDIRIDPSNFDRSKIVIQSLAGAGPDLFDFFGRQGLERYRSSGIVLDVTDSAKTKQFGPEKVWQGVRPSFMVEGRQYGFPANACDWLFIYHRDLLQKAGLADPPKDWTWQEFLVYAKVLTLKGEDGLRQYAAQELDPMVMIRQNGGRLFSKEGTRCLIDSPDAIYAFKFYADLIRVHRVVPTPGELAGMAAQAGWGSGQFNLFATKHFAMTIAGRYWYIGFNRDARQKMAVGDSLPFNIGVSFIPRFKQNYALAGGRITGVNAKSKHRNEAIRFLEFLASEPYNRQINRSFDALAPVVEMSQGSNGLAEGPPPLRGLESANDSTWVHGMEFASEWETSPFIPPYRVEDIWRQALERFHGLPQTPEDCLRDFRIAIETEMERTLKRHPTLKGSYDSLRILESEAN